MTTNNLSIINFGIVFYFGLMYLLYIYNIDYVLIGVFRELLTIPLLIAQIIFLVLGIRQLLKHQKQPMLIVSVLLLAICSFFTIGSFF